ncbi:MAG: DUF4270 domain-containing protein [Bacteroidota bacterium]|nr:DUF4270 domain-containing protein [Bacteroidota bacterium]
MKKAAFEFRYTFLFLIMVVGFFTGCQKTPIQFGEAYVDNSYSNIILVDTLTPQLSTIYTDSVATSASGKILVGSYTDNIFGKITTKSFFEVSPPAVADLETSATFDSLELIIRPDKSYYGDTTFPAKISVYQVTNNLTFPLYKTQFYNNTDFPVDPISLGSFNALIYPNHTDSIAIRLSDAKGLELFNLYRTKDVSMQSTTNFLNYFKGLQVSSSPSGMHAVYGFNDSAKMRLHYHVTGVFTESKYLDFSFYNADNTQFNQVKSDRTGTPLAVFNSSNKEVASTATNGEAYLQYLTGFTPKIQFPSIRTLLLRPDYVKILKAELIIHTIDNSYNGYMPLPPKLYASPTDLSNVFGSPLTNKSDGSYQTGSLLLDPIYQENTSYIYDVTSYLQQLVQVSATNNGNGLLLLPPSPANITTLNRMVIGNKQNTKGSIQLKLYYVSVNP